MLQMGGARNPLISLVVIGATQITTKKAYTHMQRLRCVYVFAFLQEGFFWCSCSFFTSSLFFSVRIYASGQYQA
jgi:hypothetical protein